jgi:hypothetical protein
VSAACGKYLPSTGRQSIRVITGCIPSRSTPAESAGAIFPCSRPSDYYPRKHIAMVEEAIVERIAKTAGNWKTGKGQNISVEDLLKKLTREELYDFMVRLAKNNPDLTNGLFIEFAEKIEAESGNKYAPIIRKGLEDVEFDAEANEDGYYDEGGVDIDVLGEWAEKAGQYLEKQKPREAILIAQAYIEEFARWLQETADDNLIELIPETYQSQPFEILKTAAADPKVDVKSLYDYCMTEVSKKKYSPFYMADHFNDLLMTLSVNVNPEAFIELQQSQLAKVQNKSSYEAEKILKRIFDFYTMCNEPEKAWQYVEENIQIAGFRRKVVEKNIEQKKFAEAKKLVREYLDTQRDKYRSDVWDDYLLQIAREENDIPAIRNISWSFIKADFNKQYYDIYKSAFSSGEWAEEFENLFQHYEPQKSFWGEPAADLLAAEGQAERLLEHTRKNLSLGKIEKYYTIFAGAFPEETLALFRKGLDRYAKENTGRSYYEHIIEVFQKMKKIPGGDAVAADMKALYLVKYKNRRAMKEILNRK